MILNENIHEFDRKERHIKQKLHNLKEWIERAIYMIDAKLFEISYKEEWEKTNKENDNLCKRINTLENERKRLLRKIARLEKEKTK